MTAPRLACPFSPCEWFGEPVRQQARYGDPETNWVMPIHDVVGDAAWFGRCPGSMLIVPEVTPAGRSVIGNAMRQYLKDRIARDRKKAAEVAAAEAAAKEAWEQRFPGRLPDEKLIDWVARTGRNPPVEPPRTDGIADLIQKGAARVDPRLGGDIGAYFPGRPADAPEPGPGDPPAPPPASAKDATIIPLGGVVDSARDNLNALITLIIGSCDSLIEDLARLQGIVDRVDALTAAAIEAQANLSALTNVTVGSAGENLPQPAQDMMAMIRLAGTTIRGNADQSIKPLIGPLREATAAAIRQTASARESAVAYRALPK